MSGEQTVIALDQRIGQRVRARRLELDISQQQLGVLVGVTFQQIQKYEKGTNRIAASRLFEIATALDLPVSAFFSKARAGERAASPKGALDVALAQPGAVELVQLYASIEAKSTRRKVLGMVRAMAEE